MGCGLHGVLFLEGGGEGICIFPRGAIKGLLKCKGCARVLIISNYWSCIWRGGGGWG